MFIGRKEELAKLKRIARLGKAGLVVCRGRRRIGKSTLIEQFGKAFTHFHEFQGLAPRRDITNADQLANFSQTLTQEFGLPTLSLNNWHEAFSLLANQTQKAKRLIFLDEISWMASQDEDFVGQLKIAWDTKLKRNPGLILVLCGSVSSWIDANILNSADFIGRVSLTLMLNELKLPLCNEFWGSRKGRISAYEKFKMLAITGGIPRYLEEIESRASAEANIKNMCFDESGILFNEFNEIFSDTFAGRAPLYERLVRTLVTGHHSFSSICKQLSIDPNGAVSAYLSDLECSGFIARDYAYSAQTGKRRKLSKYRLRDNYVRFYLRYIEPERDKIRKGLYQFVSMEALANFDTIMGFQFENLVLNNLSSIVSMLEIPPEAIVSASPYFQNATARQQACQIDLLIQTRNTLYLGEVKFGKNVDARIIPEVRQKMTKLKISKEVTIRPFLITVGRPSPGLVSECFFDRILCLEELLA